MLEDRLRRLTLSKLATFPEAAMWYNPFVTWLLRSPLHGLLDGNTLLLTYSGRKSGRAYTLPISYAQRGEGLTLITKQSKTWWKNVIGGAPVMLWLRGKEQAGQAVVLSLAAPARLAALLAVYHGMPKRLAEQQLPTAVVVKVTLADDKCHMTGDASVAKR
jgi:hypothetical protein